MASVSALRKQFVSPRTMTPCYFIPASCACCIAVLMLKFFFKNNCLIRMTYVISEVRDILGKTEWAAPKWLLVGERNTRYTVWWTNLNLFNRHYAKTMKQTESMNVKHIGLGYYFDLVCSSNNVGCFGGEMKFSFPKIYHINWYSFFYLLLVNQWTSRYMWLLFQVHFFLINSVIRDQCLVSLEDFLLFLGGEQSPK